MLLKGKKVAIVGGGPGGLTLAVLLQKEGFDVTVYERDINKDVRIQGGALDLHEESGLAALTKAGLMDAFRANYRPGAEKLRLVDGQGRVHFDEHLYESPQNFGDPTFRPEIDRGPLRDILLSALRPGTVVYDSHMTTMEPAGDGWTLRFENENSITADLVIGVDGARSKVRPFVTPIKPVYSGVTMIDGSVSDAEKNAPKIHKLLQGGKIFGLDTGRSLFVSSKGDGSMGFGPGWKTSEFWVRDCGIDFENNLEVLAWFKKEFAGWDEVWQELFTSPTTKFIPRAHYHMPLNQSWKAQPNVTLLGDAAHWMPPYAGEGVNMAMLDALELSEALANPQFTTAVQAISFYEKRMLKRSSVMIKDTLQSTEALHSSSSLQKMNTMFSQHSGKKVILERDVAGKKFAFVGGSQGVGKAAVLALAKRGASVLIVGRSQKAGAAVVEEALAAGAASATFVAADLSTSAGLRAAADGIKAWAPQLDGLVHSAITPFNEKTVVDGLELGFAVQHFARAVLNRSLSPQLAASTDGRVVHVTANVSAKMAAVDLGDLQFEKRQWSLMKSLFGAHHLGFLHLYEAARRFADLPVSFSAVCVENTKTQSATHPKTPWLFRFLAQWGTPPEKAARNVVTLLTMKQAPVGAVILPQSTKFEPRPVFVDPAEASALWDATTRLLTSRS